MNILLINKYHYSRAGVETVYFNTARLLESHGNKLVYFSMDHPGNEPCETGRFFVPYVDLNVRHGILDQVKIAGRLLYSFKARNNLAALLDNNHVDIAHLHDICHQISPSILHELKKRKIPVVMTLHDPKLVCASYYLFAGGKPCEACCNGKYFMTVKKKCVKDSFAKSILSALEMYLHHVILDIYGNVDVFISPSLFLKNKVLEMGFKRNIVHLYNFIYIQADGPDNESVPDDEKNTVAYVGRLSYEKGLLTLLDAARLTENMGVQVKIIGDGPLKEKLHNKVKSEQIKNVIFLGHLKKDTLYKEVKKSAAVVLPSECYENNPLSVIEAFSLSKPVIGSRLGGIPELVKDNERGLTFKPGDAKDLSLKIEYLMENPDKAEMMGKNAKAFVEEELSPDKYYVKLMEIYKEALKKSN
ncbi:MAG: glycosyltransferase family 1 protein [Nitrospiraceae bacterium]|nr:MAG: glycosyltransferase family 1 protein [Nitrospiraceae bacterium]